MDGLGRDTKGSDLRYLMRISTSCACAEVEELPCVGRRYPKLDLDIMVSCTRWDFCACAQVKTRGLGFMADVVETGDRTGNMNMEHILVGHHSWSRNHSYISIDYAHKIFYVFIEGTFCTVLKFSSIVPHLNDKRIPLIQA